MNRVAVFLLVIQAVLVFPGLFYEVGFGDGKPVVGLSMVFPVDLDGVWALANIGVNFEITGGNVYTRVSFGRDLVKFVKIELENVAVSSGPFKPELPIGLWNENGGWIVRIGESWITFSERMNIYTRTGFLDVGTSSYGEWELVLKPLENLGVELGSDGKIGLLVRFQGLDLKISDGSFGIRLIDPDTTITLLLEDGRANFSVAFLNGKEFLLVDNRGVEFSKKVGSVYVFGRFSKEEVRISTGYEF